MDLTQELNKFKAGFKANQPEEIKAIMAKATADLINSQLAENSLGKGDQMPNFSLPNAVGEIVTLGSLLSGGAVVVSLVSLITLDQSETD